MANLLSILLLASGICSFFAFAVVSQIGEDFEGHLQSALLLRLKIDFATRRDDKYSLSC